MSRGKPIFYSAVLLTAVNLLLRFVGTGFQVFLSSRIGAEGIGLLQLVLSVGGMALVAGMAGIRTATMYLTAEELGHGKTGNTRWVLSGCVVYSILISTCIASLLYLLAPFLADHWIGHSETVAAIRIFGAFLPVNCLTGVMVGYFTGAQRIRTLAAVEVAEQFLSMVCTITLLNVWAGHDPAKCCLAVVMGSALGACLTLAALTVLRLRERQKAASPIPVARRLLDIALPLAAADDLRTGISTVENLMVPRRLALYSGLLSPLAAFGTVCGMVFPILMFPIAILYGMTELLVPELARCRAAGSQNRIEYLTKRSLRIALLFGTLCAGILFLTARELCHSLYSSVDAGVYLRWFAPLAVMLYCDAVTDSIIKGLGQQKASVRYNILTNVMDVAFLYCLLPRYGIQGYFFSFLITHAINFILSIRRLIFISRVQIDWRMPVMTLAVAIGAVWAAGFVGVPLLRAVCYAILLICGLFLTNVLTREDRDWIRGLVYRK